MTDAPDDLSDVHPGVVAALEANADHDLGEQRLARILLSFEDLHGKMVKLGFTDPAEQHLITNAWSGCGRAVRVAKHDLPHTKLAQIELIHDKFYRLRGLPPTIRAADFEAVLFSKRQLEYARRRHSHDLRPEAVEMAQVFIGRLKASLHPTPL